ncbi:uncharacterized protein LOC110030877 [Phalaenopsis equestris]|uniref:uncharacterized protein LOC110030877 n=1 Tax=Phalaenopsis equestris TaxID=78828 RepID=UPI0009E227B0|nr:uncharacterized protein LOC110030877 [Phalaenopsis equestris]
MASSYFFSLPIITFFVLFLLPVPPSAATSPETKSPPENEELFTHLQKLTKPAIKTIQSPDGDVIDCVPSHLQPAFDHPKLKGTKLLDSPEMPGGDVFSGEVEVGDEVQRWRISGEVCPEGTIAVRRATESDVLRASSIRSFGRKPAAVIRRDSTGGGHEHAVGYANGDWYGAKASLGVWTPAVSTATEFSLSQIWVISGSFNGDLNTIEAGWQVNPQLYGDSSPRFFTYWTTDSYQETGCYNLLCSGFVQTTNKIAIGAAISPTSIYGREQFDITLLVWKDPKHGHWWLQFGSGLLVGYWPSSLFSHLAQSANMVQFGGEIFNSRSSPFHTATQMGSGHFAGEGFRRSAYFRNLQVVDSGNSLIPLYNLRVLADHQTCYDIRAGVNRAWGNYFYYGGPGRNLRCP